MESPNSKILKFSKKRDINNPISVDSSTYSKYDIIESNDGSGGGNMSYITREEFNAKMEVVDVKFDKLEEKIDNTAKLILSETKNYIHESSKEHTRWIIGAIAVPIILFILDKLI